MKWVSPWQCSSLTQHETSPDFRESNKDRKEEKRKIFFHQVGQEIVKTFQTNWVFAASQRQPGSEWKRKRQIENRRKRKPGGRGQLPDTARLCTLQPGRMQMSLMQMRPPLRPVEVKGRHSITQSRSAGELASLHLSSSNGSINELSGEMGAEWKRHYKRAWKHPLILSPPTPTEVTGWEGSPGKWLPLNALL